jgi:hypothetical protein
MLGVAMFGSFLVGYLNWALPALVTLAGDNV